MRALGIDLGERRIGVAVSSGSLAVPLEVVLRSGDRQRDHRRLAELAAESEVDVVVVGMPLSLDGSAGPAARRRIPAGARAEVEELGRTLGLPVETYDERLTTATAERSLREQGLDAKERRKVVDKVAAAVLLQGWLDQRAATEDETT